MPIKVVCKCGAKFAARDQLAGKDVECVACGGTLRVPAHGPSGGGGGGAGQKITLVILVLAVVACGAMLYLQQGRLKDLQAELANAAKTEEARFDALKQDLARSDKAGEDTAQQVQKVQADLKDEAKRQEALSASLAKLDMEAVRIRNNIQRVEQERVQAQAETDRAGRAKLAQYDQNLAVLRAQLAQKANAQDAARLQDEIQRVERERTAAQVAAANADRAKRDALDATLAGLQTELRRKVTEQDKISTQLADAQAQVTKLENDALSVDPTLIPGQMQKLQEQIDANRPEAVRTIVGEDKTNARRLTFRLDTRTGRVEYIDYSQPMGIALPFDQGSVAGQKAGRFDIQMTFDQWGDPYDVVRLDTETGDIWRCDLTGGYPYAWSQVQVQNRMTRLAGQKWRMSVSNLGASPSGLNYPILLVTAPDGTVYDDAAPMLRRLLLIRQ